jgi:alpha-tubulin suppressor-like RCC1 family protein
MMRWLLVLSPIVAACTAIEPDPPHEALHDARAFSVANTHSAFVSQFDQNATTNVSFTGIPVPVDANGDPIALDLPAASDIAIGRAHACIISPTGSVHCWGDHTYGALGEQRVCIPPEVEGGAPDCVLDAGIMPGLPPIRALAAGDDVTCAITMDDRVVCWGEPSRVGGSRAPALDPPTPVRLPGGDALTAKRVIINHGTVCAIDPAQRLWCWGDGFGALPVEQPEVGVLDVAFGTRHHCIIDADGLRCAGDNRNGQIGDVAHARQCGAGRCELGDTKIDLDATRVVVGERHTCALVRDGRVICFGSNEVGQLGRSDAFLVGDLGVALDGVVDLASGYAHVCARRTDLSVWCWGSTTELDPSEAR